MRIFQLHQKNKLNNIPNIISPLVKPPNDKKKIENFGILKYQNKNFKVHKKQDTYLIFLLVKLQTKNSRSQIDKKKIEDSKTSKYQNKKPSNFTRRKENILTPPLVKLHTKKLKTPKMTRRKLKTLEFFFSSQWANSCEKKKFTIGPPWWNVSSQPLGHLSECFSLLVG